MRSSRTEQIRNSFPESVDLLAISVASGLGLQAAFTQVADAAEGPVGVEWRRVVGDIRLGAALDAALSDMAERVPLPEVRHFTASVVLATELGVPLGPVLRTQAAHARTQHRLRLTEKAHTIPIKVLFPLILCLLPALLLLVAGPAALTIIDELGGG